MSDKLESNSINIKKAANLDKALSLINHFIQTNTSMSITEISQFLNISRVTAYSILNTLLEWRILKRNPSTLLYSLDYRLMIWGVEARKQYLQFGPCQQGLQDFITTTGLPIKQTHLSALVDEGTKTFRFFMPRGAYSSGGSTVREHYSVSTADGLLLLAYQSEDTQNRVLQTIKNIPGYNNDNIDYQNIFKTIKSKGISYIADISYPYNIELAAPIRNSEGSVEAAISFIFSKSSYMSIEDQVQKTLIALSNDLSIAIGYPGQNGSLFLNRHFEY